MATWHQLYILCVSACGGRVTPGEHRWSLTAFVESIQFICYASEFSDRTVGARNAWACDSARTEILSCELRGLP